MIWWISRIYGFNILISNVDFRKYSWTLATAFIKLYYRWNDDVRNHSFIAFMNKQSDKLRICWIVSKKTHRVCVFLCASGPHVCQVVPLPGSADPPVLPLAAQSAQSRHFGPNLQHVGRRDVLHDLPRPPPDDEDERVEVLIRFRFWAGAPCIWAFQGTAWRPTNLTAVADL